MKFLFKILMFFSVFLFFSCSAEIVFEVKKDGNVKISYDGDLSGDFLQFLINQNDKNAELDLGNIENTELDVEVLTESLKNSGFENVQILSGKLKNILITMEDKSQKSVLFYSKLLKMQNGSLSVDFSYENLRNFYENAD